MNMTEDYPDIYDAVEVGKTAIQRLYKYPNHKLYHLDLELLEDLIDRLLDELEE